nr:PilZ domain-containing protein [Paenibacillus sp. OV219]
MEDTVAAASATEQTAKVIEAQAEDITGANRRRSERLTLNVPLKLSVYQWEQEGAFSGQLIDSTLCDISDNGIQLSTTSPLELDMFVVIHYPQDSELPPMIGRIIRIETTASRFRYGCLLAGLAPYQRLQLEAYINKQHIIAD